MRDKGKGILLVLAVLLLVGFLSGAGGEPKSETNGGGDATNSSGATSGGGSQNAALTWSLQMDNPDDQGDESRYRAMISSILKDPKGWKRLGRSFKYVDQPKDANYRFRAMRDDKIADACRHHESAYGCGYPDTRSSLTPCTISFDLTVVYNARRPLSVLVINHELGHCLGLGHKKAPDLMQAKITDLYGNVHYPSNAEIAEAKKHLG